MYAFFRVEGEDGDVDLRHDFSKKSRRLERSEALLPYLAGLATGLWSSFDEIGAAWRPRVTIELPGSTATPLIRLAPVDPPQFPETWIEGGTIAAAAAWSNATTPFWTTAALLALARPGR